MITVARLLAVPLFAWLLLHGWLRLAFVVFLLAGLSDAVDGFLARRWRQETGFGARFDPLADKLLMASAYGSLGYLGHLPAWLVLLVIGRDVMILAAVATARVAGRPIAPKPVPVSKANTAVQILLIVLVLTGLAFGLSAAPVITSVIAAAATLTILSGAAYVIIWIRHMRGAPP